MGGFCGSIPEIAIQEILKFLDSEQSHGEKIEDIVTSTYLEYNQTVAPFTFAPQTSLEQVHGCFITLRLSNGWVTRNGKVLGTITRLKLMEMCSESAEKARSLRCH